MLSEMSPYRRHVGLGEGQVGIGVVGIRMVS